MPPAHSRSITANVVRVDERRTARQINFKTLEKRLNRVMHRRAARLIVELVCIHQKFVGELIASTETFSDRLDAWLMPTGMHDANTVKLEP